MYIMALFGKFFKIVYNESTLQFIKLSRVRRENWLDDPPATCLLDKVLSPTPQIGER